MVSSGATSALDYCPRSPARTPALAPNHVGNAAYDRPSNDFAPRATNSPDGGSTRRVRSTGRHAAGVLFAPPPCITTRQASFQPSAHTSKIPDDAALVRIPPGKIRRRAPSRPVRGRTTSASTSVCRDRPGRWPRRSMIRVISRSVPHAWGVVAQPRVYIPACDRHVSCPPHRRATMRSVRGQTQSPG